MTFVLEQLDQRFDEFGTSRARTLNALRRDTTLLILLYIQCQKMSERPMLILWVLWSIRSKWTADILNKRDTSCSSDSFRSAYWRTPISVILMLHDILRMVQVQGPQHFTALKPHRYSMFFDLKNDGTVPTLNSC